MRAFIRVVLAIPVYLDFLIFPRLGQFEMEYQTVRARDRLIPGGISAQESGIYCALNSGPFYLTIEFLERQYRAT